MTEWLESRVDPGGIQNLFDASKSLEPKSILIQVIAMTGLSILTILAFNILRPNNKVIYEPKTTYHAPDKRPPRISDSFCGWIPPLFHNHESQLINKIGLDAIAFLRFLHLMRWLFTLTALVTCGALIPLDFLYTMSTNPPQHDLLSAMTIRDVKGVRLYAHIACTYLIAFFLMILVLHHWRAMHWLRHEWFRSSEYQHAFYTRTLLVTHIPPRLQSNDGLYKIFHGMNLPYQLTSVQIGRRVGELPELIDRHNDTVQEFEEKLARHSKKASSGEIRPTVRVGGFCGLGGTREDAIKFYTTRLKHTEAAVQQYRAQIDLRRAENYGFASMASIPAAHGAAYDLRSQHPKGLTIKLAPNPKDIVKIWRNIKLSKPHRRFRRVAGFILLVLFCMISLIPLFPVASLANLNTLAESGYIPFLQTWIATSPTTYSVVSGILPPAVAAVFGYFLPRLMRWLSRYMGASTTTGLDRVVIARYFTFMVISQLIIFTVLGVILHSIFEIIDIVRTQTVNLKLILDNLDQLPARLTRTYVDQSAFWLKWFPLRGFLIIFDLAQLFNLIWIRLKTRFFGRTPREIREWTKPPAFEYSVHYSNFLFMGAVGLLFAPLAPLVSLAAALVFWLCSWVYKHQLMFVFVTHIESGGRSWNAVVNRLLFSAMFMQVIMIFTIGLQDEFKSLQLLASIPPLLVLLLFKYYLKKRFANDFQYFLPQYEELSRAIVHSEESDFGGQKLAQRYGHPALQTELLTPMVHAQVVPLLRRIYRDKHRNYERDLTRGIGAKSSTEQGANIEEVMEGVTLTPVNEDELAYDPALYSRDREKVDRDFDSVNPTSSDVPELHLEIPQMASRRPNHGVTHDRSFGHESQLESPGAVHVHTNNSEALHGAPSRRHHQHQRQRPPTGRALPSYNTADNHCFEQSRGHTQSVTPQTEVRRDRSQTRQSSRRHHSAHNESHHTDSHVGRHSHPAATD